MIWDFGESEADRKRKKSDFSHFQEESVPVLVADSTDSPRYLGTPTNATRLVVLRIQQFAFSELSQLCPHSSRAVLFTEIPLSFVHRPPFITSGQNSCGNRSFREIVSLINAFPFLRNRKIFVESSYHRTSGEEITLKRFLQTPFPRPLGKSFSLSLFHRQ